MGSKDGLPHFPDQLQRLVDVFTTKDGIQTAGEVCDSAVCWQGSDSKSACRLQM